MKEKTPREATKKPSTKKVPESPKTSEDTPATLPGLSKKTRPELMDLALSLGLPVEEKDRRIDLIERINAHASGATTPALKTVPAAKTASPAKTPPAKRIATKVKESIATKPLSPEIPPAAPPQETLEASRPKLPGVPGWKDFLDVAFEPVRRERGHYLTMLPLSPFRIMAFFATDPSDPSPAFRHGHPNIILKVRDITDAMESGTRPEGEDLPADHIFDISTGGADRWRIPLWASHRWIEGWLGYYEGGTFHLLARSKRIRTPRGGPANAWGHLFHLKEGGHLELENGPPWLSEDAAIRRLARLPASHERPASHTRP
jgi:hypothetical protein